MKLITIFTPTYNRAYCIKDLYESLRRQTSKDFIWMIINDGSTDNTKEIIQNFIKEDVIEIQYIEQINQGKMIAHNKAASICRTDLFMCLDSDDILTDDAIELVHNKWQEIKERQDICGILAPRQMLNEADKSYIPLNNKSLAIQYSTLQGVYQNGYIGETALAFNTQIIKKYPFPVVDGEKFISEVVAYDEIDKKYKYAIIQQPLMICEYRSDGYSKNIRSILVKNPKGQLIVIQNELLKKNSIKHRIRLMVDAIAYSRLASYSLSKTIFIINKPIITFLLLPLGIYYHKTYKKLLE